MLSWDDYRFFLAVARCGSLSAAARALSVTQPTVGRRIDQMEAELKIKLFERTDSGFCLTDAGKATLHFAEAMDREAEGAGNCLARYLSQPKEIVRIATTLNIATCWLTEKLAAFKTTNPNIRLAIRVGIQRADVSRYKADIALRMGEPGDDQLFGRRIGQVHCGLYASQDYIEDRGMPGSLAELSEHSVIDSEGEIENLPQVAVLRDLLPEGDVHFGADNTTVQMAAVRCGLGIAALPCFMADPAPNFLRILPDVFDIPVDLWLLVNRDLKETGSVRRAYDFLARAITADAALFSGTLPRRERRRTGGSGDVPQFLSGST
ncbi:LysR family transcriptional regulator [Denitrobaculum tricleocarpae]|uniref:LysR family transcriptional regulator n=1 Tax=Denitrobaculum tricleocarpae TaxID=2591009 RepID=A0A545TY42_9PROT|nr:LysR family transcriptional regulator [Denitrobaculum tricleocarpae]TQV82129.1 LysR family transcriptional regulator [Denitrobaculum tricleocarpae]